MRLSGIYAIVDRGLTADPVGLLDAVLAAGVGVVQYRAKDGVDPAVVRALHARTRAGGALLIVNDDLEAALLADGVHLGQEDLALYDAADVRARLGTRLLGISCGEPEEARAAEKAGADYIGVGPFARTATKADAGRAMGVEGIRGVAAATRLPAVAVGGIGPADIAAVVRS